MASATTDVVVLGGGPAGAAASRLLASWGHSVRLITKPDAPRLAVSLPPSCAKLFDAIGVAGAIDRAGFVRSTGNTVWWGSADARVETFANGAQGWQVDLGHLEHVLLAEAGRAGVLIERCTIAADRLDHPGALVLDCTGRSGLLARAHDLRRHHDGPTTIALAGEWHSTAWDLVDDSHTVIESYADGWMWSVPVAGGTRHVSAMIDPQRSDLVKGRGAREVYLAEIAKTRAFGRLLSGATLAGGPAGWDASTYYSETYAGDAWLLVGDAGSFIDPLSSAGVKKALASAWLAAVAVNTCLRNSAMRGPALQFFSEREREIERHHDAQSRAFLASAARGHSRPFWAERAAEPRDSGAVSESARRALDELRQAVRLRVSAGAGVRVEPRPLVVGNEIRPAPHLIDGSDAVRYLHGVDLVKLLELAPQASQVPDLFEMYARHAGVVSLHDFLAALSTAVARGWLVRQ